MYRGWEKAAESAGWRRNKQECRVRPGDQTGPQGNCCNLVLLPCASNCNASVARGLGLGDTSVTLTLDPAQVGATGSDPLS